MSLLTVEEALKHVLAKARPLPPATVSFDLAIGWTLAEDIAAEQDSPSHDKSMMDGYAVCAADLATGAAELEMLEEVTAGMAPTQTVVPGSCTRIMTGAPLPAGADAVVMIERTHPASTPPLPPTTTLRSDRSAAGLPVASRIHIRDTPRAGQNILRQGACYRQGELVLRRGLPIGPAEMGLLAELGRESVLVTPPPKVAILATGNELVPMGQRPGPGQIRNSNGPMLVAAAKAAGGIPLDLGIARDEPAELRAKIEQGLAEADLLVLSGGVSAGVLDLAPAVFAETGVREVFHKVRLKPGKPLWFGVEERRSRLVFGVPGNPVSSFVCFEVFVRPAIEILSGRPLSHLQRQFTARLAEDFVHRGDRPTYFPCGVERTADGWRVQLSRWIGSADLRGLAGTNALALFPAGDQSWKAGDEIEVRLF